MKRKLLSGESFFQNTFTAGGRGGRIGFAPGIPGDVLSHELEDGELKVADLEIVRLDNDRNAPENGVLTFELAGGI